MGSVLIVGAGPGGAVLAYLLARRGQDVTLIERHDDFAREFRGEVLLPGGLEPFSQMGLWDRLDAVPHVQFVGGEGYLQGQLALRLSFRDSALGRYAPRWISQPGLLEMLVAESQQHASFRFERGVAVTGLIEEDGRTVGVRTRDAEFRADLVVGADGRTSIVRRKAGFAVREDRTPMDVVWCKVPLPPGMQDEPRLRFYAGGGHILVAAPVYDGTLQLGWVIRKGSFGELRKKGMEAIVDAMARHASPDLAAHLLEHRGDATAPFLLSTVSDRVDRWTRPGLLLIGDAAHTMSPVGAQGLNIAIRDAVVAANHLVPALEAGAEGPGPAPRGARVRWH